MWARSRIGMTSRAVCRRRWGGGTYIQKEAEQFLTYAPDKFFEVSITGESLGITHTVKAIVIVEDSKVRYIRWQEDP